MIAVLVNSRRVGSSAKVAVRNTRRIRASGLDGDRVRVHFFGEGEAPIAHVVFSEDGHLDIPDDAKAVVAEHEVCGKGRVFIDLVRAA